MFYNIDNIIKQYNDWPRCSPINSNRWVLARPEAIRTLKNRFKGAWMVFTGKADVLTWTDQ